MEFGSKEAQEIVRANKQAAERERMTKIEIELDRIDWDSVSSGAEIIPNNFHATASLVYKGRLFSGSGDAFENKEDAVDDAIQDIRWQVKMALKNGEI